ncbi:hypothetical protein ACHZ97_14570 [Lysobacter soli]|uniref:hypothetical protein n=1 Tax=Lysobacter soli TaxID=453783 RepID=UPI0037CB010C
MILDSITEKITLVLAGATTTTAGDIYGSWTDSDPAATPKFNAGSNTATTSGTSSVDVIPVPGAATARRSVDEISVCNNDSQPMTVTIRHSDGATHRRVFGPCTLQVGEKIQYKRDGGWNVFTVTGAVKVTAVQSTVEPGYIDGLVPQWVSTTAITVSSGTAYIPSVGANVNVPAAIASAGLSLSANTWYHIYLFLSSGVPAVEFSATAPSVYDGTAAIKTGDPTRRYIGSVRTIAAGAILKFSQTNLNVDYLENVVSTTLEVLSNGLATVATNVSLAAVLPPTSKSAFVNIVNASTNSNILLSNPDANFVPSTTMFMQSVGPGNIVIGRMSTNASQLATYMMSVAPSPNGAFIRVNGYNYVR